MREGWVFDFIKERGETFRGLRSMGPRPEGLSRKKYIASHWTGLTNIGLEEIADTVKVKVSYGVMKRWRMDYLFKAQEGDNQFDFGKYWYNRMERVLQKQLGATFDIDQLQGEFKLYSFDTRVEIGHKLEELVDIYGKTFPFIEGMAQKFLSRHIFLQGGDQRQRDAAKETKGSPEKAIKQIETSLDRIVDYVVGGVEDEKTRSLIWERFYSLVQGVGRLGS